MRRILQFWYSSVVGWQKGTSRLTVSQRSMAWEELSVDTIRDNTLLLPQLGEVSSVKLREAPFPADNNLLTTRELELSTTKSLLSMVTMGILATNRQKNLSNSNTSTSTQSFTKSTSHTSLKPISSSTRKHLVNPENMERMNPNPQMKSIFSSRLHHVLVASNTGSFKCFTWHILLLPWHQMDTEWKLINTLPLHTNIVDPDFWIWHTTTVARLWVWLTLDLTVTPRRS